MAEHPPTGTTAAGPATGIASPATGTADAVTGTADAASAVVMAMRTAAIGTADCPATGLLARAATELDKLDLDILDAMIKLFGQILTHSERIAERFGVPLFCVKALHIIDTSMAMKELGQRMGCDPSFVTAIADTLEKRGLARREASAADRRVKNLVLSTEGIEFKGQLEKDMLASMPWSRALDTAERESFLALVLKLVDVGADAGPDADVAPPAGGDIRPAHPETAVPSDAMPSDAMPSDAMPSDAMPSDATASAPGTPADATVSSPATPTGGGRAGEVTDALDTAPAG